MFNVAKIEKITAIGCNKRFMHLKTEEKTYCIRISDELYRYLKKAGVPTAQSLRKK